MDSSMTENTYIDQAKQLLALNRHAILSTISAKQAGFPFGSLVPFDISPEGNIIVYVSLMAEHYKNLQSNPKASLTVTDPFSLHDPQAYARATILTCFEETPSKDTEQIRKRYENRFPGSINYEIAHNFVFLLGRPLKIRWIGGFGSISWLDGEEFN